MEYFIQDTWGTAYKGGWFFVGDFTFTKHNITGISALSKDGNISIKLTFLNFPLQRFVQVQGLYLWQILNNSII